MATNPMDDGLDIGGSRTEIISTKSLTIGKRTKKIALYEELNKYFILPNLKDKMLTLSWLEDFNSKVNANWIRILKTNITIPDELKGKMANSSKYFLKKTPLTKAEVADRLLAVAKGKYGREGRQPTLGFATENPFAMDYLYYLHLRIDPKDNGEIFVKHKTIEERVELESREM